MWDYVRVEVNEAPKRAPLGYESLGPCEPVGTNGELYKGSGVPFDQHPLAHANTFRHGGHRADRCGECGSDDVLCIYFVYFELYGDRDGTIEVVCRRCRRYTSYHFVR